MFSVAKVAKPLEIVKNVLYIVTIVVLVGIAWGSNATTTANSTSDITAIKADIHEMVLKLDKLNVAVSFMQGQLQTDHDRKK